LQKNDSTVMLDPVEFGRGGQWAISIWFRPNPSGLMGNEFEYIFSQGRKGVEYTTGYEPNQVTPPPLPLPKVHWLHIGSLMCGKRGLSLGSMSRLTLLLGQGGSYHDPSQEIPPAPPTTGWLSADILFQNCHISAAVKQERYCIFSKIKEGVRF